MSNARKYELAVRRAPGIIRVDISVVVLTKKKDGRWFATCPLLKSIGSSAISKEAAIADHREDIDAFLNLHLGAGTLDSALLRFGWIKKNADARFEVKLDIPAELLESSFNESRVFEQAA